LKIQGVWSCEVNLKPNGIAIACFLLIGSASFGQGPGNAPYKDPSLPPEQRSADLVSRMTLEERILQMQNVSPAIPRLGIPVYNWWNEALHGVATGRATVFPESIALGATWDVDLMHRIADAISTEARAKYNEAQRQPPVPEVAPGAGSRPNGGLDVLVAEHQHLPRSPLGQGTGDLR
jgi:beta-glucosidase